MSFMVHHISMYAENSNFAWCVIFSLGCYTQHLNLSNLHVSCSYFKTTIPRFHDKYLWESKYAAFLIKLMTQTSRVLSWTLAITYKCFGNIYFYFVLVTYPLIKGNPFYWKLSNSAKIIELKCICWNSVWPTQTKIIGNKERK